jgi:hypothetical protein
MSCDHKELIKLEQALRELSKETPAFMESLIVGEGVYAAGQARRICRSEKIVNTGQYRYGFHAGDKGQTFHGKAEHDGSRPKRGKNWYRIDVYNNVDYAKHLEYGFRAHFVPGHWEGRTFVYQPYDEQGGMYVGEPGGYVRGRFVLRRAIRRTKTTQEARLNRKMDQWLRTKLKGMVK